MINKNRYAFAREFYIIEKTVQLEVTLKVEGDTTIKIDALFNPRSKKYHTLAYSHESYTIQPTFPQKNYKFTKKPEPHIIWVSFDLAWTLEDTADDAITKALAYLKAMCL